MGATDLQALRELVGGGVRMPDMRAVPKIKGKDTNLEEIIKYIKLQRYYMTAARRDTSKHSAGQNKDSKKGERLPRP